MYKLHLILKSLRQRRIALIALLALGFVGVAAAFSELSWDGSRRVSAATSFVEVFRTAPPGGVTNLRARRQYQGTFDQDRIVLEFEADRSAIDAIVKPRHFTQKTVNPSDWDGTLELALPTGSREGVTLPPMMTSPVLFECATRDGVMVTGFTRLLWDAQTGRAWVIRAGDEE